jgi:hypothetical protein
LVNIAFREQSSEFRSDLKEICKAKAVGVVITLLKALITEKYLEREPYLD